MRPRVLALSVAILGVSLASCGASSSASGGKVNQKYAAFCVIAADLQTQSSGTHGSDPMVMSDPTKMKTAWTTIIDLSDKLLKAAPSAVKSDISVLVDHMNQMNKVFKSYAYNLEEMAAVPAVQTQLAAIQSSKEAGQASTRFSAWMKKNCGA
jgi:hypothetical protein